MSGGPSTAPTWGNCDSGAITGVGTYSTTNTDPKGASVSSNQIIFQSASASAPGMVDTGTQTFAGNKTFSSSATTQTGLQVSANSLTTGGGLKVSTTSGSITGGNLLEVTQSSAYGSTFSSSSQLLYVNRTITGPASAGTVALDSTSENSHDWSGDGPGGFGAHTLTSTHTISGTNRLLMVSVYAYSPATVTFTSGSTYPLTKIAEVFNGSYSISQWVLLAPPTGAGTVSVSETSGSYLGFTASSWTNVDQTTPYSTPVTNTGTSTSVTTNVTTATGQKVVDIVLAGAGTTLTPGAGQTVVGTQFMGIASSYKAAVGSSTSMTWSWSGSLAYKTIATALHGITIVGATDGTLTGSAASIASSCLGCTEASSVLNLQQANTFATGAVLSLQNSGLGADIQLDSGILRNVSDSVAALSIQNSDGSETLLAADTTNNRIIIGDAGGAITTSLVLDAAASDPTGVAGAMYYNTTSNIFKCYTTGWFNCSGSGVSVVAGSGTDGRIAKFSSGNLADSGLSEASTTLTYAGNAVVNAATGFTGNLLDLKLNGTSKFSVTEAGNATVGGSVLINGGLYTGGSIVAGNLRIDNAGNASNLTLPTASSIKVGSAGAYGIPYVDSSNVLQFANINGTYSSSTKCLLSDGTTGLGFGTCPSGTSAQWTSTGNNIYQTNYSSGHVWVGNNSQLSATSTNKLQVLGGYYSKFSTSAGDVMTLLNFNSYNVFKASIASISSSSINLGDSSNSMQTDINIYGQLNFTKASTGIQFQDGTIQTTAGGSNSWTTSGSNIYQTGYSSGKVFVGNNSQLSATASDKLQVLGGYYGKYSSSAGDVMTLQNFNSYNVFKASIASSSSSSINLGDSTNLMQTDINVYGQLNFTKTSTGIQFQDGTIQTTAGGSNSWTTSGSNIYQTGYSSGKVFVGTNTQQSATSTDKLQVLGGYYGRFSTSVGDVMTLLNFNSYNLLKVSVATGPVGSITIGDSTNLMQTDMSIYGQLNFTKASTGIQFQDGTTLTTAGGANGWTASGSNIYQTGYSSGKVFVGANSQQSATASDKLQVLGGYYGRYSTSAGDVMTLLNFNSYNVFKASIASSSSSSITLGDTANSMVTTLSTNGSINGASYSVGGTAGVSRSCTGTQALNGIVVSGGIITAGTCTTNGADLAEAYNSTDSLVPGELVMASGQAATSVKRATDADNGQLMGIVSTDPSKVIGTDQVPDGYPIALSGRVPTKVNTEGGAISVGDKITISSIPGVGKKATGRGMVVGTALGAYNGTGTGTIEVFVHLAYYEPADVDTLQAQTATLGDLNVSGTATINNLTVTGLATVHNLAIGGHIITTGGQPTSEVQAAAGSSAAVTVDGTDTLGTITITTGDAPTAGEMARIVFSQLYTASPRVVLSPSNDNAAGMRYFKGTTTTDGFMLNFKDAPAANTTYTFDYFIGQ